MVHQPLQRHGLISELSGHVCKNPRQSTSTRSTTSNPPNAWETGSLEARKPMEAQAGPGNLETSGTLERKPMEAAEVKKLAIGSTDPTRDGFHQ